METGARGLVRSLFIYSALLWLAHKNGADARKAIVGLVIWSCLIELMQMGLLGRTADVTEPLLLMLVGWVLGVVQSHQPRSEPEAETATPQLDNSVAAPCGDERKTRARSIAIGMAICVAIAWLITRSELTPYNVRELVYHGHPFRSLALLVALLYWSVGFPVFIARWLTKGGMYIAQLPAAGIAAWFNCMAADSIRSANRKHSRYCRVPRPGLAMEVGTARAFSGIVRRLERSGHCRHASWPQPVCSKVPGLHYWAGRLAPSWLCRVSYYIVVSQASTDNLVELMANNGGVGSFLLIGSAAMLMLLGGAKAALAFNPGSTRADKAIVWVLGAGALAYFALHFGLEQIIVKYGHVFSALQFLLSSSRSNLAGTGELVVRYALVYSAFVAAVIMVQGSLWRWVTLAPRRDKMQGGYVHGSAGSSHTPHLPTSDR